MAVKAVCCVTAVGRDSSNHAHFVATVNYAALVDASIAGTHYVYDLDPSALAVNLTNTIEGAMKTFLEGEGVSFGLLDTVRLVPGI